MASRKPRPWEQSQSAKCYIYFVQGKETRLIKIGCTKNINQRIREMQTGSPDRLVLLGIIAGSRLQELKIHKAFSNYRVHGEWFDPSETLLAYIDLYARKPKERQR